MYIHIICMINIFFFIYLSLRSTIYSSPTNLFSSPTDSTSRLRIRSSSGNFFKGAKLSNGRRAAASSASADGPTMPSHE